MKKYIPIIKKCLKMIALVIAAIWLVGYVGSCFTEWELLNPIKWVIDLPTDSTGTRSGYLASIVGIVVVVGFYTWLYYEAHPDTDDEKPASTPPPANYHREYLAEGRIVQQPQLDAVDIAVGVASGIVVGGIIDDIFD